MISCPTFFTHSGISVGRALVGRQQFDHVAHANMLDVGNQFHQRPGQNVSRASITLVSLILIHSFWFSGSSLPLPRT
jgi:hypothetical protein